MLPLVFFQELVLREPWASRLVLLLLVMLPLVFFQEFSLLLPIRHVNLTLMVLTFLPCWPHLLTFISCIMGVLFPFAPSRWSVRSGLPLLPWRGLYFIGCLLPPNFQGRPSVGVFHGQHHYGGFPHSVDRAPHVHPAYCVPQVVYGGHVPPHHGFPHVPESVGPHQGFPGALFVSLAHENLHSSLALDVTMSLSVTGRAVPPHLAHMNGTPGIAPPVVPLSSLLVRQYDPVPPVSVPVVPPPQ
jgi:hypothetical protein